MELFLCQGLTNSLSAGLPTTSTSTPTRAVLICIDARSMPLEPNKPVYCACRWSRWRYDGWRHGCRHGWRHGRHDGRQHGARLGPRAHDARYGHRPGMDYMCAVRAGLSTVWSLWCFQSLHGSSADSCIAAACCMPWLLLLLVAIQHNESSQGCKQWQCEFKGHIIHSSSS